MNYEQNIQALTQQLLTEIVYGPGSTASGITQADILERIRSLTEPNEPIKFVSVTPVKLKKNPLGTIYKISRVSGALNPEYAKEKQEKMDIHQPGVDYVPGKSYGTHETGSVVDLNGAKYIMVKPIKSESPIFVQHDNIGQLKLVNKSIFAQYEPAKSAPSPVDVVVRKYKLENIVGIEIDDIEYFVIDMPQQNREVLQAAGTI